MNAKSSEDIRQAASNAFKKAWDYSFSWNVLVHVKELDQCRTQMGHAVFAAEGTDYSNQVFCPFEDVEEVLEFDPLQVYGTINHSDQVDKFNADYKKQCEMVPDAVNTTGIYITLVSGLIEIFGWDMLLMALGVDAEQFGKVADRYTEWILQYFKALADYDAPVVKIHDDIVWTSGAFVNPDWYRKYVFPNYKKLFSPLREAGKKIIYTSDGNYTQFIDDIVDCGINGFVLEPITDMKYIAEKYGKTHAFIGNVDTRVLLNGTKDDIYREVKRCMDIGKKCPGFFMAVGNHIPANTPVENALFYNEVYQDLRKR